MTYASWPPFENTTYFSRYVTSPTYVADLRGNIFGRSICRLSFIALTFSEYFTSFPHPCPRGPPSLKKGLALSMQCHLQPSYPFRRYLLVFPHRR